MRAFIRRSIESGRFHSEDEAVQEALSLWEGRERERAEVLAALDEADTSLVRAEPDLAGLFRAARRHGYVVTVKPLLVAGARNHHYLQPWRLAA